MRQVIAIGNMTQRYFSSIGQFSLLIFNTFRRLPLVFKNIDILMNQMRIIGLESLWMVLFTAAFIGAETVIQAQYQFTGFAPLSYLGFVVSKALISELIPVVIAFVISSRITTAMAAEIGNMQTTEQIDALTTLSLDPYRYVFLPRVIAAMIMVPVLVILAMFIAFSISIIIAYTSIDMSIYTYLSGLRLFFIPKDLFIGIAKTSLFGGIIALSGIHFGLRCSGGAKGIGNATTFAVMLSALLILCTDFIVALLFL